MNLPLYFVSDGKNDKNSSPTGIPFAQYFPECNEDLDSDILIVTDKTQPAALEAEVKRFCDTCRACRIRGVFFDYEKPVTGYFVRFAELVQKALPDCFYLLPEHYAAVSEKALILCTPCLPQNSWELFCKSRRRCYASRWALELIPYQLLYENGKKAQLSYHALQRRKKGEGQRLLQAVCMSQRTKRCTLVYDTAQTLHDKLDIAEEYGCQLALGLTEELRYFF